jgi:hypothetical protein
MASCEVSRVFGQMTATSAGWQKVMLRLVPTKPAAHVQTAFSLVLAQLHSGEISLRRKWFLPLVM